MKTFRDNKGFTLIELLAVIVVLAIVTVIATRSVLPYMKDAGRDTFVTEANMTIQGAADAMSLIQLGKAEGKYVTKSGSNNTTLYCFTLKNLNDLGTWQKDDINYDGKVVVTVPSNSSGYTYAVTMHNDEWYVTSESGTIKNETAVKYEEDGTHKNIVFDCTSY